MEKTTSSPLSTLRVVFLENGIQPKDVHEWWEREAHLQEDLIQFLVRKRVLITHAVATMRVMKKGYAHLEPKMLFTREAFTIINTHLGHRSATKITLSKIIEDTVMMPIPRPAVGKVVGRCRLTRLIGCGGGGTVFEALHMGLGITVAVKMLNDTSGDEELRSGLRAEARLLAQLNHPNIVRVYDFCDDGPEPYLVMEYVKGSSLEGIISQCGNLRQERAAGLLVQTVAGLGAAWQAGIVHRDVKPGNILINQEGQVKIADLGLAWYQNRISGTGSGHNYGGTLAYMAPERFGAVHTPDIRSDMYSLGVLFYEMLTGELPFRSKNSMELMIQHIDDPIPDLTRVNPNICEKLVAIQQRLMAKNPSIRYGNYYEVMEELAEYFRQLPNQEQHATWNPFLAQNTLSGNSISSLSLGTASY
ncbi:MAG: serine/threonine protein kinase [Fimbriiglobus sp.]